MFVRINNNIRPIMVTISTLGYNYDNQDILVIGHFTYFVFIVDRVLSIERMGCQEWNTY